MVHETKEEEEEKKEDDDDKTKKSKKKKKKRKGEGDRQQHDGNAFSFSFEYGGRVVSRRRRKIYHASSVQRTITRRGCRGERICLLDNFFYFTLHIHNTIYFYFSLPLLLAQHNSTWDEYLSSTTSSCST